MTVTLDAAAEARIQQEIDCGTYRDASEVIAHALALLDDEPELSPRKQESIWMPVWSAAWPRLHAEKTSPATVSVRRYTAASQNIATCAPDDAF